MTDPRTEVVDGVTTFWVDTGRPTLAASLLFRGGRADEPLNESGWLHLLEHLALEDRAAGTLHVNGSVSALTTSFDLHGPAEAVCATLNDLTGWLGDPALERVAHERKVLAAESAWRGRGPLMNALGWRFGAVGPGVMGYDELGLTRATPERLAARAREVFTTGNAVLVLDGPPPPGLRLDLPAGASIPVSPVRPVEDGPGAYGDGIIIATGLVPREHASTFATEVLRSELEKVMRHSAGHVYTVNGHYEHVSEEVAVVGVSAETRDKNIPEVVEGLHRMVIDFAARGPAPAALEELYAQREQAMRDPAAAIGNAYRAAHRHLAGKGRETLEQVLDDMRAVTTEDVREVLAQVSGSLLLGTPAPGSAPLPLLPDLREVSTDRKQPGRRWRSVNAPADRSLIVLDGDVVTVHGSHRPVARTLTDLAAYLVMPGGYRSLIGRDGFALTIDPTGWRDSERLVDALDAGVPEDLHVPRALDEKPAPIARRPFHRRLLGGLSHGATALNDVALAGVLLVAVIIVLGLVGLVLEASGRDGGKQGPVPILVIAFFIGLWAEVRKARRLRLARTVS